MGLSSCSDDQMTKAESRLYVGTVVKHGDRILLVRQSPGHPLEGQWTVPWGAVEVGESAASAAIRETLEEGGITADLEALIGVQDLPPPQEGCTAIIYLCRHVSGSPVAIGRETDAAGYFGSEELESLDESIEPLTKWLVKRVLLGEIFTIPPHPDNPLKVRGSFI